MPWEMMVLSRATRGLFWSRATFTSSEKQRVDDRVDKCRDVNKEEGEGDTVNRLPTRSVVGVLRKELDDTARNIDERERRFGNGELDEKKGKEKRRKGRNGGNEDGKSDGIVPGV
jgi:hypothetical protein